MSDCEHLNHPEHWLGDCGDMLDYIALPATTTTAIGQVALDALADMLHVPTAKLPRLGPFVASIR